MNIVFVYTCKLSIMCARTALESRVVALGVCLTQALKTGRIEMRRDLANPAVQRPVNVHPRNNEGSLRLPLPRRLTKQGTIIVSCTAISGIILTACYFGNLPAMFSPPFNPSTLNTDYSWLYSDQGDSSLNGKQRHSYSRGIQARKALYIYIYIYIIRLYIVGPMWSSARAPNRNIAIEILLHSPNNY